MKNDQTDNNQKDNHQSEHPQSAPKRPGYPHCPDEYKKTTALFVDLLEQCGCKECTECQDCPASTEYIWDDPELAISWEKYYKTIQDIPYYDLDDEIIGDLDQLDDMDRIDSYIEGLEKYPSRKELILAFYDELLEEILQKKLVGEELKAFIYNTDLIEEKQNAFFSRKYEDYEEYREHMFVYYEPEDETPKSLTEEEWKAKYKNSDELWF